jgi:hypothetical protein
VVDKAVEGLLAADEVVDVDICFGHLECLPVS